MLLEKNRRTSRKMRKNRNNDSSASGIVLLAKQSGRTSFSSLFSVKRALNTTKVGHTGTLDSFADGLLVVLTGKLTRLVPHITNFDKTYLALIEFGSETDTLDPTGKIIRTAPLPTEEDVKKTLPSFLGEIEQVPPMYSALHVDGKRLSDLAREGKSAEIKPRKITIYSIKLLDFYEKYALVEVSCSKGTYIRSLARDIANSCKSAGHLRALRRTKVGPFSLKDAVGTENLDDFTIEKILSKPVLPLESDSESEQNQDLKSKKVDSEENSVEKNIEEKIQEKIRANLKDFDFDCAKYCGMVPAVLNYASAENYRNGRPVDFRSFYFDFDKNLFLEEKKNCFEIKDSNIEEITQKKESEVAVFYPDLSFAGCMKKIGRKFNFGFVIPSENRKMKIYTWEQIENGKFDEDFRNQGIAGTIGSFDGSHLGHQALFDAVLAQKNLVPGVITFSKSMRAIKDPAHYVGDVVSLSQKLESLESKGFKYVINIDFSDKFAKLKGRDFLHLMIKKCGLKYLAEGKDFHCGYKGQTDMNMMAELSLALGFRLDTIDSVMYKGEKVSSSRIRSYIIEKRFDEVKDMLQGCFAYDCSGLDWKKKENSDGKLEIFAEIRHKRIVSPDGKYKVTADVILNGSKSGEANVRAFNADCTLENGALHLAFSDNLISGFVRTVYFGYPEEK